MGCTEGWVAALRRFVRPASAPHCEVCGLAIGATHDHLVDASTGQLSCACGGCAVVHDGGPAGKLRRVPRESVRLADLRIGEEEWSRLGIPVGIAFFFRRSASGQLLGLYPGAAGAMASELDLSAWADLEARHPVLATLAPDVEALLVNHLDGARDYYRMPIDRCYALAGLIRAHWAGFTGGDGVRAEVARFLAEADAPPQGEGSAGEACRIVAGGRSVEGSSRP